MGKLHSLGYVCDNSILDEISQITNLDFALLFQDKNYSLFNYDFRATIIYDKKNDFFLCFRRRADFQEFEKESVEKIYLLNSNTLMPIYSLERELVWDEKHDRVNEDASNTITTIKWSSPSFYIVELKNIKLGGFNELNYSDILRIFKELEAGEYIKNNPEYTVNNHFTTNPYWTED